jgi:hypothetical protein
VGIQLKFDGFFDIGNPLLRVELAKSVGQPPLECRSSRLQPSGG